MCRVPRSSPGACRVVHRRAMLPSQGEWHRPPGREPRGLAVHPTRNPSSTPEKAVRRRLRGDVMRWCAVTLHEGHLVIGDIRRRGACARYTHSSWYKKDQKNEAPTNPPNPQEYPTRHLYLHLRQPSSVVSVASCTGKYPSTTTTLRHSRQQKRVYELRRADEGEAWQVLPYSRTTTPARTAACQQHRP